MKKIIIIILMLVMLAISSNSFAWGDKDFTKYEGKIVRIFPKRSLGTVGEVIATYQRNGKYFLELRLMKVFGQHVIFIINAEDIQSIEIVEKNGKK